MTACGSCVVCCVAPPRFVVIVGAQTRQACGRHLGWLVDRMTVSRHVATVRRLETSQR